MSSSRSRSNVNKSQYLKDLPLKQILFDWFQTKLTDLCQYKIFTSKIEVKAKAEVKMEVIFLEGGLSVLPGKILDY